MDRRNCRTHMMVEEAKKIDTADLNKQGKFNGKYSQGSLSWEDEDDISKIEYEIRLDSEYGGWMRLVYQFYDDDGGPYDFDRKIKLTTSPCNYGGRRWWFHCPDCGRRVRVIYLICDSLFKCRKCCDLRYRSSQRAPNRAINRLKRLCAATGAPFEYWKMRIEAKQLDKQRRRAK